MQPHGIWTNWNTDRVRLCLLMMYWQMNVMLIQKTKQKVFLHHVMRDNVKDTLSKFHHKMECID